MNGRNSSSDEGPPEVVLHLGAHRTATTLLQKMLVANRSRLLGRGVRTAVSGEDFCWRIRWLAENDRLLERPGRAGGALEVPTDCERLVISEENVFCAAHEAPLTGLYGERTGRVEVLRHLFGSFPVRVLFYVRDYAAFLESCFVKQVDRAIMEGRQPKGFDEYLREVPGGFRELSWKPIISAFQETFGKDRIHLARFEELRGSGVKDFCRRFFSKCGLSTNDLNLTPPAARVNPRPSRLAIDSIAWIHRTLPEWLGKGGGRTIRWLDRRMGLSTKNYLDKRTRKELNVRYARDCADLF